MGPRTRVLVAEDDPLIRSSLSGMLEASGYEVSAFPDGSQAWDAFCAQPFDLVISDIAMPGGRLDGHALLDAIKRRSGHSKVILMTGLAYPDSFEKISQFPPDSLILKPFGREEIERAMRHCLGSPDELRNARPAETRERHSLNPFRLDPAQITESTRLEVLIELANGHFETLCTDQEPFPAAKATCLQRLGFRLWTRK